MGMDSEDWGGADVKTKQTISLKEGDLDIQVEFYLNGQGQLDVYTTVNCNQVVADRLKEELKREGWINRFMRIIK